MHSFSQHQDVTDDLDGIYDYITLKSPSRTADVVVDKIRDRIKKLRNFPELYSGKPYSFAELPKLRTSIVRFHHPYTIYFTDNGSERRVLYVHHSSREDIEDKHKREKRK